MTMLVRRLTSGRSTLFAGLLQASAAPMPSTMSKRILQNRLSAWPSPTSAATTPGDTRGFASAGRGRSDSKGKKGGSGSKHLSALTDDEAFQVINVEALRTQLEKSVDRLRNDFVNTLTVRTSVGSIETLAVSFDGQKYPLNEIAQVVRKNPGLAIINLATAPTAIPSVLEAIAKSGMNLNPRQEGTTISVPLPQVTREHRETLAKNAKSLFVRAKDELKETQNKFIKDAKEKKGVVSDDLIFSVQNYVTALTDQRILEAQTMLQKKHFELVG